MHRPYQSDAPATEQVVFYTIGEAADILGISIPTIRMYEREGLILPNRKRSKHRRFSESDLERIRCMRAMINTEKVSIAGIRRLLSLIPCWAVVRCTEDDKTTCAAYNGPLEPCWIQKRKGAFCATRDCKSCEVYAAFGNCQSIKDRLKQLLPLVSVSAEPPKKNPSGLTP